MKKALLLLFLLGGCGRDDPAAEADNRSAPAEGPAAAVADGRLTGLYEGGAAAQKNQLCIVEEGGEARFGLVVWGANLHSCSGAGRAVRAGERLTLRMTGDETCAIEATLEAGTVALPRALPTGCAYYCGARASLAGASFTRTGTTEADAHKATDIAGDRLCD